MNVPSLADVLAHTRPEAMELLVSDPQRFVSAARSASSEVREALISLLEELWPTEGFHALLTESEEGIPQIERRGWAWLVLGPAVDASLSYDRWAEIATSGFVLSDQARWLSAHFSEQAIQRAVEISDSDEVRLWGQVVSAVPHETPLPAVLVTALTEQMRSYQEDRDFFSLSYISRRLAESARLDALRALAAAQENFARVLRKPLASAGDSDAAEALLVEMLASLEAGERVDRLDVEWLEGVSGIGLLPLLFDCLSVAYRQGFDGALDVAGPLIAAIRRVGTDETIRRYDEIIDRADESKYKFLRRARDEIVSDELRKAGRTAARRSAASLGLPFLAEAAAPIVES